MSKKSLTQSTQMSPPFYTHKFTSPVKQFSTFGAKAIAGIGNAQPTIATRSIPIRLERSKPGTVEEWFEDEHLPQGNAIQNKMAAWVENNSEKLKKARPHRPSGLSDRQKEVTLPLLAIADLAGGDWPVKARQAIVRVIQGGRDSKLSIPELLLKDIKAVFEQGHLEEIGSEELCIKLAEIETSPWAEWDRGKAITKVGLAKKLKAFSILPGLIGGKYKRRRGYALAQFKEAFEKYLPAEQLSLNFPDLPETPDVSVHTYTAQYSCGPEPTLQSFTRLSGERPEKANSPSIDEGAEQVNTLKGGSEQQAGAENKKNHLTVSKTGKDTNHVAWEDTETFAAPLDTSIEFLPDGSAAALSEPQEEHPTACLAGYVPNPDQAEGLGPEQ